MTVLADPPPPLVVFADDWGRHPSSCQHLIRELLPRFDVRWFNTVGMRPPRMDLLTLRRGWEKLSHWSSRSRPAADAREFRPRVVNPKMWPWFRSRIDRRLNRSLMLASFLKERRSMASDPVVVTTIPIVADLVGHVPAVRWVYYCVDDFSNWPGLDGGPIESLETELVSKADVLIAAGGSLRDRLSRMGRGAHLLTHGVDLSHWSNRATTVPTVVSALSRPLVVFWGVVDRRLDVATVARLSQEMAGGTIVLAGPEQDPDPALWDLPRIARIGPLPYAALPALAHEAEALIMPYAPIPENASLQPLKLKEYLASGRPVIVTDLPAAREWSDALDVASDPVEFSWAVLRRLATGLPTAQGEARRRLSDEGWSAKARQFERWIAPGRADVSLPIAEVAGAGSGGGARCHGHASDDPRHPGRDRDGGRP